MGILIQGGRIVDAATDTDKKGDIYLEDGVITEIGEKLKIKDKSDKVIDAKGCLVMPGLIDLHVHFRDPGQTQKEDIETGSRAAARGGLGAAVPARIGQVKLVLGAGDAHVEQAAFFLQPGQVAVVNDALVWEHAVTQADQEDDGPFQPLGLVDGG